MNCKNKKIISMLIASGILLSPNNAQAMESMVDFINEDSKTIEENIGKIEKENINKLLRYFLNAKIPAYMCLFLIYKYIYSEQHLKWYLQLYQ